MNCVICGSPLPDLPFYLCEVTEYKADGLTFGNAFIYDYDVVHHTRRIPAHLWIDCKTGFVDQNNMVHWAEKIAFNSGRSVHFHYHTKEAA